MATNVHDLIKTNACDSSQDVCKVGECELCLALNLSLSDFDEEKKTISFLNWQREDKNFVKINQSHPFDPATEKWNSTILTIKKTYLPKAKASGILQTAEVGFEAGRGTYLPLTIVKATATCNWMR